MPSAATGHVVTALGKPPAEGVGTPQAAAEASPILRADYRQGGGGAFVGNRSEHDVPTRDVHRKSLALLQTEPAPDRLREHDAAPRGHRRPRLSSVLATRHVSSLRQ
jgi:hypothetical protein